MFHLPITLFRLWLVSKQAFPSSLKAFLLLLLNLIWTLTPFLVPLTDTRMIKITISHTTPAKRVKCAVEYTALGSFDETTAEDKDPALPI